MFSNHLRPAVVIGTTVIVTVWVVTVHSFLLINDFSLFLPFPLVSLFNCWLVRVRAKGIALPAPAAESLQGLSRYQVVEPPSTILLAGAEPSLLGPITLRAQVISRQLLFGAWRRRWESALPFALGLHLYPGPLQ